MNRTVKASSVIFWLVALMVLVSVTHASTATAEQRPTPPSNDRVAYLGSPRFFDSSFAVVPGSTVSLHWSGGSTSLLGSGVHFLVTSSAPKFSSSSVVHWPAHTSPTPTWNGKGWHTKTTAMSVAIPASAAPRTEYKVAIQACTSNYCAAQENTSLNVPASSMKWTMKPYGTFFSKVATFAVPKTTQPLAITFMSGTNSIWNASEYSHDVIGIPSTAKEATVLPIASPAGAQSNFKAPFAECKATACVPGPTSALSEQVTTANRWVWTTFGGWRVYANGQRDTGKNQSSGQPEAVKQGRIPANHSEVVALDPNTRRFCTYLVPGNNTQVAGIAAVGSSLHTQIWFAASSGPSGRGSLDEFNPSTIGRGCDGRTDRDYVLPASVKRLSWPSSGAQWPVQIAVDPSSTTLWISNFNPYSVNGTVYSGIDRVDISDPAHPRFVQRYVYPTVNLSSFFGAKPWDVVAPPNSDYVYTVDNGDAEIVRINKVTNQLQEIPIPLTTDLENAFGLAVWRGSSISPWRTTTA